MKLKVKQVTEVDVTYLKVRAGVRYWEDSEINGQADEEGELTPAKGFGRNTNGAGILIVVIAAILLAVICWDFWKGAGKEKDLYRLESSTPAKHGSGHSTEHSTEHKTEHGAEHETEHPAEH